jgi:hypothetical protein
VSKGWGGLRFEEVYKSPRGSSRLGMLEAHVLSILGIRTRRRNFGGPLRRQKGHSEAGLTAECVRKWLGKDRFGLFVAV